MKKTSFVAAAALLLPLLAFAAYNDVSMTTDAQVTISGETLSVSGSTASIESIAVGSSSFDVALQNGSTITVSSANSRPITTTAASGEYYTVSNTCTGSNSKVTISSERATAVTVTVTVDPNNTCSSSSSTSVQQGGPIGGGGGGGGGGAALPHPVTPAPTVAQASPIARAVSPVFNTDLAKGSRSDDVHRLQELLSKDKDVYPEGIVNGVFGPLTEKAVKRFQAKYKLPQVGRVGPATRAKLSEVFGGESSTMPAAPAPVVPPAPTAPTTGGTFTRSLAQGQSNAEVKLIQILLNKDPDTQIAVNGSGSPGHESEFFGTLTRKAVGRFQEKYGIAKPGDAGYGNVGPKTRVKLNELSKNQ